MDVKLIMMIVELINKGLEWCGLRVLILWLAVEDGGVWMKSRVWKVVNSNVSAKNLVNSSFAFLMF